MKKILLGTGILNWNKSERVSDRYGAVFLDTDLHADAITPLLGKKGKLICEVLETRASNHIGDLSRGISPSTPKVGDTIELGEGILFTEGSLNNLVVGLKPEDERATDWLNPHKLYNVHAQTVNLFFEEAA